VHIEAGTPLEHLLHGDTSRKSDAGARRSVRVTTLLGVLAATMRGAGSSPVSLCADSRYQWRRRRIRALGTGRIAHFHAAGWPPGP
jgi:hypothetical protein